MDEQPVFASNRLVCVYDRRFSPERVRPARLETMWFEKGTSRSITARNMRPESSIIDGTGIHPNTTLLTTSTRDQTHQLPVTTRHTRKTGEIFSA